MIPALPSIKHIAKSTNPPPTAGYGVRGLACSYQAMCKALFCFLDELHQRLKNQSCIATNVWTTQSVYYMSQVR